MPTYEYRCATNGHVIEVKHRMSESISTWGELCQLAEVALGDTEISAPVEKVIAATTLHTPKIGEWKKNNSKPKPQHVHGPGCGCGH